MLERERVEAALSGQAPDVVPIRMHPSPGGLYEHGQALLDLMKACGHDFGDNSGWALPAPPPESDFDPDGSYHAYRMDDWGTRWEYRTFGVWGCPVEYPLADMDRLDAFRPPSVPSCSGESFKAERSRVAATRERYYSLGHGGSLFEKLHALRPFENVLMDIADDTPEIRRLEDMLEEHCTKLVDRALALGHDAVGFGDDFGTQTGLLMSPTRWREFFAPRYRRLCGRVHAAGRKAFLHCCGKVDALLADFAEVGFDAIWPQLPVFDGLELARRCRDLGMSIELHPDRGDLMQRGTPDQIRSYILDLVETLDTASGGSWLYLEVDPGFAWANVDALFSTVMELRGRK